MCCEDRDFILDDGCGGFDGRSGGCGCGCGRERHHHHHHHNNCGCGCRRRRRGCGICDIFRRGCRCFRGGRDRCC